VLGVIQFDPDFDLDQENGVGTETTVSLGRVKVEAVSRVRRARRFIRDRLLRTPFFGSVVQATYRTVRLGGRSCLEKIIGRHLPRCANLPLLQCWELLASEDLPMLVLTAEETRYTNINGIYRYDYLGHLLRKKPRNVTTMEIKGTNHHFTSGGGKTAVIAHVERWLLANLPPASTPGVVPSELPRRARGTSQSEASRIPLGRV
jgi:hypothetical protein